MLEVWEQILFNASGRIRCSTAIPPATQNGALFAFTTTGLLSLNNVSTADVTPPSISITFPSAGATVSGTNTAVTATASDNVGVLGVQFLLDGSPLGAEDTIPPYAISWDTTLATNASHTLTARARDAAGSQTTSAPITVTVNNAPPPDTTAPTIIITSPANGAIMSGAVNSITATASDNVAVVGVQFLVDSIPYGAEDTSPPYVIPFDTTAFADGSHTLTARARDAAGNTTPSTITITINNAPPPDTTPPTAPTSLTATPASPTAISLSWAASTDAIGVTGYRIERCTGPSCSSFSQIGTTTAPTTTYSDSAPPLTATTSYTYQVKAVDAANNVSSASPPATAITLTPPDTTAPTQPTSLVATAISTTAISLSWTASTDAVGVTQYRIERCTGPSCSSFSQIATGPSSPTSYGDSGLTPSTSYTYRVLAVDAAVNISAPSTPSTAVTLTPPDTTPPTQPTSLVATTVSDTTINLAWTASTDNVGVTGYRVERCSGVSCSSFAQIATPAGNSLSDTGLTQLTSYTYRVYAVDAAVNVSTVSATSTAVTNATPDTTVPTAPTINSGSASSPTQIDLGWTASTDNIAVTGYRLERCQGVACSNFSQIAAPGPSTLTYSDTPVLDNTTYRYRVYAIDAALNVSAFSNTATFTTPVEVTPPSQVVGLTANPISPLQINLAWTAATDNVAVTGYKVERCTGAGCSDFAEIATPASNAYNDTGRSPGTSYSYQVRATDAASNLGAYSSVVTAVTPADLVLRLKMDSAVNSMTFTDDMGHTVTTNGFVVSTYVQSKFGGTVAAFNGWNGRLVVTDASDLTLPGDFCIEGWAYHTAAANNQTLITLAGSNWRVYRQSAGTLRLWTGSADVITGAATINPGSWYHWAWVRLSGVMKLYLNGTAQGSPLSNATSIDPTSILLGTYSTLADFLGGYMDEVQIRTSAVYTANFTPPTASFGTDPTPAYSPADLFKLGEQGVWYDVNDLSTLWQDNAGTTPVTAVQQTVGRITDKSGRGNHLIQATAASRPSLSASRNYSTNTNLITAAAWTKTNVTVAQNGTDPHGGLTSFRLTETATATVTHFITQSATFITGVAGGQHTLSVYAKAAERTSVILQSDLTGWNTSSARFNLTNGTVEATSGGGSNALITDAGNGWWRCSLVATANAAWAGGVNLKVMLWNGTTSTYTGNTSSGVLIAWPQLNPGANLLRFQRWGAAQPDYDIAGFPFFLSVDGTDDGMATVSPVDFSATDKMSIWVGLFKNPDSAQRLVLELGPNVTTTNGSFALLAPGTAAAQNYSFQTRGTTTVANSDPTPYPSPRFEVSLSCQFDNGSASATVLPRVSGIPFTAGAFSTAGNFGNQTLYVGRRGGTTLPLTGGLYNIIVRAGLSTLQQITDIELWMASRTSGYLPASMYQTASRDGEAAIFTVQGGVPYAPSRAILADIGGPIFNVANGIPLSAAGRVVFDKVNPIVTYNDGVPFTALGGIAIDNPE